MNTTTLVRPGIRWLIRRDMPEVLDIEYRSFEFYWTEEDFLRCLRQRNCIGMVAEIGETVVGFMLYELLTNKINIINLAVDPRHRRSGLGTAMIDKMITKLSSHRRTRLVIDLRETNLVAQLFFHNQGFRAVRVLPKFYEDSGEDAYHMILRHDGGA